MDNKTSSLKRVNDSLTENKRQRPKLNGAPRIPVRTTIASRSKKISSTSAPSSLTRKPPVPKRICKSSKAAGTETPEGSDTAPKVQTSASTTTEMGRSMDPVKKLSLGSNTMTTNPSALTTSPSNTPAKKLSLGTNIPAKKLSLGSNTPAKTLSLGSSTPVKKLSLGSNTTPMKKKLSLGSATTTKRLSLNGNTTKSTPLRPSLGSSRLSSVDKTAVKRPPATITRGVTKKQPVRMPKFPGDIKGKLNYLQSQLELTGEQVLEIEKVHDSLQSTVKSKMTLLEVAQQKVQDLETALANTKERCEQETQKIKEKYMIKNKDLIQQNAINQIKYSSLEKERDSMQTEVKSIVELKNDADLENEVLKKSLETATKSYAEVGANLHDWQMKLKSADTALNEHDDLVKSLSMEYDTTENSVEGLEKALFGQEKLRRKLHNKIQDLKGNIRVFCRVRQVSQAEDELTKIRYFGEDKEKMELSEQVSTALGRTSNKSHSFSFDRVFSPTATQQDCFVEISQLVQSALDGFNVCIFAYGQTGSGKTYTMEGPPDITEETVGMIPRAVQQIYDVAQKLKRVGWEYTMEGQFLEIYNKTIHDLLGDATKYGQIKHEIHHDAKGNTTVSEMSTVKLESPSQVKQMLKKASQNRATGATKMNERSSRSHSVFTLKLTGHNTLTGERTAGILNLIDLAGSERLSSSGSEGDRLAETKSINQSLSCLGDVIHALVNNKEGGHIPYRNSKLTWLLRNSLGGNCKTLMFVNVSPKLEHFDESISSLRFATKVNSCKVGIIKKS
ncbi:hypothetical protein INT47_004259 [Mucor saturninus]|uniref:Kinesin motor domain-containing protein n=1 Tax=Mucor saturninus TaxID=64648 RepID=A0A8H7RA35_9FUNG|nr:hypothetical protein INT47_004259 [Mucor saturninus]